MMKNTAHLRFLLIQLRKDPHMLPAERQGFIGLSQLHEGQFEVLDAYRKPVFPPEILNAYDAFIIGGLSDDRSDSVDLLDNDLPFIESLCSLIRFAIQIRKPGLLSCGGFMIASNILGAEVVLDPERAELGIVSIHLTEAGREDPLFKRFPASFKAVSGHKKSTLNTPPGCTLLLTNEHCPVHGFRVDGTLLYGFQFHPEIRCEELKARVEAYKSKYFDKEEAYRDFISLMDDTMLANSIVRRFVELVARQ